MKKSLQILCLLVLLMPLTIQAQVTIGSDATPDANALLDLKQDGTTIKGLLLPRVALTATAQAAPLTAHVAGMTVYNTATAGDVKPGYYYNDGTKWVRIMEETALNFWSLTGNKGTTAGTNFLGTTDDQDLMFKRNSIQAGRLGTSNTTYGLNAGTLITGTDNVAVGVNAGSKTTTGTDNVAIGVNALTTNANGDNSIAIGKDALKVAPTSLKNIAIGSGALASHTGATLATSYNIAVGYNTLNKNTTGGANIAFGNTALGSNTSGSSNIAIGISALFTNATGSSNISIGRSSSNKINGSSNTVVGFEALATTSTGSTNVVIGYQAAKGEDNTNSVTDFGSSNTAVGSQSMKLGKGSNNTTIGSATGANLTGDNNVVLGGNAMNNTVVGSKNVVLGAYQTGLFPLLTNNADNNIMIGYNQGVAKTDGAAGGSNQLNIGGAIFGTGMTGVVNNPAGKIGILATQPTETFQVSGTARIKELPPMLAQI